MSRLRQILLATAMMAAAASDDRVYKQSNESGGMSFNPNYRPKPVHRELREFTVKGQKIMAYSKKDAVTKLRHQKEIGHGTTIRQSEEDTCSVSLRTD